MFCKIFSDDQEMATNQKIGLCDYLRTERMPPGVKHISCLIHKKHTVFPTEQPSYIIVRIGNTVRSTSSICHVKRGAHDFPWFLRATALILITPYMYTTPCYSLYVHYSVLLLLCTLLHIAPYMCATPYIYTAPYSRHGCLSVRLHIRPCSIYMFRVAYAATSPAAVFASRFVLLSINDSGLWP